MVFKPKVKLLVEPKSSVIKQVALMARLASAVIVVKPKA